MNIQSAINQGVKILKDKLINNPQLDSEILMSKVINKDKKYLLLNHNKEIEAHELKYFKKLINKMSYKTTEKNNEIFFRYIPRFKNL